MVTSFGLIVFIDLVACFTQMGQHVSSHAGEKKKVFGFVLLIELRAEMKNMIFSDGRMYLAFIYFISALQF